MRRTRRAFFFTLSSIFILFLLTMSLTPNPAKLYEARENYYHERLILGQEVVSTFRDAYIPSIIQGLAPAVFTGITSHMLSTGKLYASTDALERDVLNAYMTGKIDDTPLTAFLPGSDPVENLTSLLQNFTRMAWDAYKINMTISMNPQDYTITLEQNETSGPWYVYVTLTFPYNISLPPDEYGQPLATWELYDTIPVLVPITSLPDPYLSLLSQGWYNRTIAEYALPAYWDSQGVEFRRFAQSKRYIYSNRSFSFLDRFTGRLDHADCCGILTIITPDEYAAWNQTTAHESLVKTFFSCDPNAASMTSLNYTAWSFVDCEYFIPALTPQSCRNPNDAVYAVKDWSNATPLDTGSFPFTITSSFAVETFNLTIGSTSSQPSLEYLGEHLIGLCAYQAMIGLSPGCGNGVLNYGEECDEGANNGNPCVPPYGGSCTYCSESCTLITVQGPSCGDGEVQSAYGEECDPPQAACTPPYGGSCTYCNDACTYETLQGPYCGDGTVQSAYGEECDEGSLNGDAAAQGCDPAYGESCTYCDASCKIATRIGGVCGDGIVQSPPEACDYKEGTLPVCNVLFGECCTTACELKNCFFGACF